MRRRFDPSLYLVTDRGQMGGRDLVNVVEAAARGGVTVVQLREKDASTREFIELARRLKPMLADLGVPLIINDRVDVALATGADGVHLGRNDMDYATARRLLGPEALIGISVETGNQQAPASADYLGVSPIFDTPTKRDTAPAWGLEGLRRLRAQVTQPLVAIGGIHLENARLVMEAGADGIAVVSAICTAEDPEEAARELRRVIPPRS
ncbi:MAG: thiamine phosphate synthase [Bryobacterales bacterium]|nr:thiamine phosphate synthase [Bryobacterales bacterium]